MARLRRHLTYANVGSTVAVFLLLAGGTAFAASQLAKNSVGSKQLQKNAVTAAKIKKNAVTAAKLKKAAVTRAKIKAGAVGSSQIADGAVTGTEINVASTPFARMVGGLRQTATLPWTPGAIYPVGTYTQPVGEDNIYQVAVDFTIAASCTAPRVASAYVLVNPANPAAPTAAEIAGQVLIEDNGAGAVTRRVNAVPAIAGFAALAHASPLAPEPRTFYLYYAGISCGSGSGISVSGASVDVLGVKSP